MNLKKVFYIISVIAGIAGAAVSCGMLIRALEFLEWGRVFVYAITLAVSVEIAVLFILKLKPSKKQ